MTAVRGWYLNSARNRNHDAQELDLCWGQRGTRITHFQRHTLDQLARSPLKRFDTLMHVRAPYAEGFLTGQPPHFGDRTRAPVQKAVDEIEALMAEVFDVLGISQQKAAA